MKKPLPEIAKCACGKKAKAYGGWYVHCANFSCWCGPARKSARAAILAWNRVMRKEEE